MLFMGCQGCSCHGVHMIEHAALPMVRAKKDTQTQRFHTKIPCLYPPFLGAFNPRNSLCSDCVFPSKYRKNANTKNFEGGARGGRKKLFVLDFFGCFFSLFKWENPTSRASPQIVAKNKGAVYSSGLVLRAAARLSQGSAGSIHHVM